MTLENTTIEMIDEFYKENPDYIAQMISIRYPDLAQIAEDIAQETYIKASTHARQLGKITNYKAWLTTIAKNTAIDHLRKTKCIKSKKDDLKQSLTSSNYPDERTDTQMSMLRLLDSAAEQLSPPLREVYDLVRNDHDTPRISEILGISRQTARTRYFRMKNRLKEIVETLFNNHKNNMQHNNTQPNNTHHNIY